LVSLPPYSPELNPAQRSFQDVRRVVEGEAYATLDDKVAAVQAVVEAWDADLSWWPGLRFTSMPGHGKDRNRCVSPARPPRANAEKCTVTEATSLDRLRSRCGWQWIEDAAQTFPTALDYAA
jgi:hypothetical protein